MENKDNDIFTEEVNLKNELSNENLDNKQDDLNTNNSLNSESENQAINVDTTITNNEDGNNNNNNSDDNNNNNNNDDNKKEEDEETKKLKKLKRKKLFYIISSICVLGIVTTFVSLFIVEKNKNSGVTYSVGIDANGGTIGKEIFINKTSITYGTTLDKVITSDIVPVREDYTFNGWSIEGTIYKVNELSNVKVTHNLTAVAKWEGNPFDVTYKVGIDANGGTIGEDKKSYVSKENIPYGATLDKVITEDLIPNRIAYEFKGWTIEGKEYNQEDLKNISITHNITAVAKWEELPPETTFTVFLDANGGKYIDDKPSITIDNVKINTPLINIIDEVGVPVKDGEQVSGYKIEGIVYSINDLEDYKVDHTISVQASWTQATIKFIAGESKDKEIKSQAGKTITYNFTSTSKNFATDNLTAIISTQDYKSNANITLNEKAYVLVDNNKIFCQISYDAMNCNYNDKVRFDIIFQYDNKILGESFNIRFNDCSITFNSKIGDSILDRDDYVFTDQDGTYDKKSYKFKLYDGETVTQKDADDGKISLEYISGSEKIYLADKGMYIPKPIEVSTTGNILTISLHYNTKAAIEGESTTFKIIIKDYVFEGITVKAIDKGYIAKESYDVTATTQDGAKVSFYFNGDSRDAEYKFSISLKEAVMVDGQEPPYIGGLEIDYDSITYDHYYSTDEPWTKVTFNVRGEQTSFLKDTDYTYDISVTASDTSRGWKFKHTFKNLIIRYRGEDAYTVDNTRTMSVYKVTQEEYEACKIPFTCTIHYSPTLIPSVHKDEIKIEYFHNSWETNDLSQAYTNPEKAILTYDEDNYIITYTGFLLLDSIKSISMDQYNRLPGQVFSNEAWMFWLSDSYNNYYLRGKQSRGFFPVTFDFSDVHKIV